MIELRQVGSTLVLSLAAGRANALDYPLLEALGSGIDQALAAEPRALVVTGTDSAFCAGLALPTLLAHDRAELRAVMNLFSSVMRRLLEAPVPTVAAINGGAIAGGCVLALMCDQRVMVGDGPKGAPRIGLPEAQLGIGVPAIVVEPARHKLTPAAFAEVVLGGALHEPAAAKALGLVDEVTSAAELQGRTLARATAAATAGREAYAQIKAAWTQPMSHAIADTHARVLESWLDTWFSDEGQQRMRAQVARMGKSVAAPAITAPVAPEPTAAPAGPPGLTLRITPR